MPILEQPEQFQVLKNSQEVSALWGRACQLAPQSNPCVGVLKNHCRFRRGAAQAPILDNKTIPKSQPLRGGITTTLKPLVFQLLVSK